MANKTKKDKQNNTLLIVAFAGIALYLYLKKKKPKAGPPIITDIPVTDPYGNVTTQQGLQTIQAGNGMLTTNTGVSQQTQGGQNSGRISYVGILPVTYMAGVKGDLGALKTN